MSMTTIRPAMGAMAATALVALASGCGNGSALGDSPTVSGRIQGWTQGKATLDVWLGDSSTPAVSAPIDAAGNFSVTLPGAAAVAGSLGSAGGFSDPNGPGGATDCGAALVTPNGVQDTIAGFSWSTSTVEGVVTLGAGATTDAGQYTLDVLYAYFNGGASVLCNVGGPSDQTGSYDVSEGWNTLLLVGNAGTSDVSPGPPPSAAQWTASEPCSLQSCAQDSDCCTGVCDSGSCSCLESGSSCSTNASCCSGNCFQIESSCL
jgi:hypothetical protein